MTVGISRYHYAAMSQALTDYLKRYSGFEHQNGMAVSYIMEANNLDTRALRCVFYFYGTTDIERRDELMIDMNTGLPIEIVDNELEKR